MQSRERAVAHMDGLAVDDPDFPPHLRDPRLPLARAAFGAEEWGLAAEVASAIASDVHAQLLEALHISATAFAGLDHWDEALRRYDSMRPLAVVGDELAMVETNRAWVLGHLDRGTEALAATDCALALALDPDLRPRILLNRAFALSRLDRYPEALAVAEEASILAPGDADIAFDLAGYLAVLGRHPEALQTLGHALAIDPSLGPRARADQDLRHLAEHADSAATFNALVAAAAAWSSGAHD